MKPELLTLTPEQAGAILTANNLLVGADPSKANRKFDKNNAAKFVSLIKTGLWKTTHQGIAITEDGRIIDGQHRLTAIRDAGIPVTTWIFWDADASTFDVLDQGKKRSGNDIWQLGGHSGANIAAIAKLVWCYENLPHTHDWHNNTKEVTSTHVFNWANDNQYARAIQDAANMEARIRKEVNGIGSALGASIAISEIFGGVASPTVYSSVYEPLVKCVDMKEGMPVHTLHRILSRRDHSNALATGNVFCRKQPSSPIIARARLGILLRVIADTIQGNSRSVYPFSTVNPLPNMRKLQTGAPVHAIAPMNDGEF